MRRSPRRRLFAALLVVVPFFAAAHELAVALKWIPAGGSEPGEESFGSGLALAAGTIAMIGALVYFVGLAARDRAGYWLDTFIPVAGAALMVAHFYAFDPYFFPDLQRYSENEFIALAWVYGLAVSAIVSSVALFIWPRGGRGIAVAVVLLSVGTLILEGGGH